MWCWEEGCGVIYTLQLKEGKDGERGRSERWKINIKIPADFVAATLK